MTLEGAIYRIECCWHADACASTVLQYLIIPHVPVHCYGKGTAHTALTDLTLYIYVLLRKHEW